MSWNSDDSETWHGNLRDPLQLLTGWDNSQSDLTTKIVCGIANAHKWATYLTTSNEETARLYEME